MFCLHQYGRYYDSQYICARTASHSSKHHGYLLGSNGGMKLKEIKDAQAEVDALAEKYARFEKGPPVGLETLQGT